MKTYLISVLAALLTLPFLLWAQDAPLPKPIKALMITGGCCHEYATQKFILSRGISARANVEWTIVHQGGKSTDAKIPYYTNKDWHKGFDVVVHNECFANVEDKAFIENILKPHREGLPSIVVHCAMHSYRKNDPDKRWKAYLGVDSPGHGPHYAYKVDNIRPDHPAIRGFGSSWTTPKGELYHVREVYDTATPLAEATRKDGKTKDVCIWVNQYGKGKVFGTTIGHYKETMEQPEFLDMITRGLLWAVGKLDDPIAASPAEKFIAKQIGEVGKPATATPAAAPKTSATKTTLKENLAFRQPASGSPHQAGRDHMYAFDGNAETRWCGPNNNAGHTLQVDLGKPRQISGIRILWEQASRLYQYKIEGSADGKTWNVIADQTKRKKVEKLHELDVKAYDIRHVRLTPTKLEPGGWGSIWEMEVLGTKNVKRPDILQGEAGSGLTKSGGKIQVPDGYTGSLFGDASKLGYPTCLTWGSDNWLYVGLDPNGSLGKDPKHNGRIVRARDLDGDGEADEFQTCVEGIQVPPLNTFNPRGIFVHGKHMIVLHPPELSAFTDTDGDGVFEDREVLVKDISAPELVKARGADHCTNGFMPGIDGWLYIAVGDFGFVKAVGADGKEMQLYGGGIVRVRPNGAHLELYARGLRNVYDVAVSPTLECFTRDNTNDGGGWNVRLSHVIGGGAEYGYPYLFKNFPDDRIPRLEDYGGGSPCGSLWLDEPTAQGLFTCDWGRSKIYLHSLEANGADYTSDQKEFIGIPRPTDMDVDFEGRLYISSWEHGGFRYSNDGVGFVAAASPSNASAFNTEFATASEAELLALHVSPSHKQRLHAQIELVLRQAKGTVPELAKLAADTSRPLNTRTAALFTMLQLSPRKAHPYIATLAQEDDPIRPLALRALSDRRRTASKTDLQILNWGLQSKDPKARLQAAIGLGRIGNDTSAVELIKVLGDEDPLVRHAAVKSLTHLEAVQPCLRRLSSKAAALNPDTMLGLTQVLDGLHNEKVVQGLIEEVKVRPSRALYQALCRLYHKEDKWSGKWWGTRPDTRGPYYSPVTWEQTPVIAAALKEAMTKDETTRKLLLSELPRHRIKLEGFTDMLLATAAKDPAFAETALDVLMDESSIPASAIPFLTKLGMDETKTGQRRGHALQALAKVDDSRAASEAALQVMANVGSDHEKGFKGARNEYLRSGKRAKDIEVFIQQAPNSPDALAIVTSIAGATRGDKNAKMAANTYIANALDDDAQAVAILNAINTLKLGTFSDQIRVLATSDRPAVSKRAQQVAKNLKIDINPSDPNQLIGQMKYEDVVKIVNATKGDPKAGATFFQTTGCVACHTVSKDEPLKGPYLGDITTRYNRTQLTESILKPNAVVATAFASHWFQMKDKTAHMGFIIRESGEEIEIRNIAGLPAVLKTSEIAKRGKQEASMMPPGLCNAIKPADLASMLAYLEFLAAKKAGELGN